MKKLIVILLSLSIIMLTACSADITSGTIANKEHKEKSTQTMLIPMCVYNGKTTTTIFVPMIYHYPERYVVIIEGNNEKSKTVHEDFYVNQNTYNKVSVGDKFAYDEETMQKDEPYTEEEVAD